MSVVKSPIDIVKQMERNAGSRELVSGTPLSISEGLPMWPESCRGIPNPFLRSAMFSLGRSPRQYIRDLKLESIAGMKIVFTGPQLDQADMDVLAQCLHLARASELKIQFTAYSFLRSINRNSIGASQYKWLREAITRLTSSVIDIEHNNQFAYFEGLLKGKRDAVSKHYVIEINPNITKLFGSDSWTMINWEQRQILRSQPLAQWLHGFYASHARPYPIKVSTLHRVCGSQSNYLNNFRDVLRDSLMKLYNATGWLCHIDDNDLVNIKKVPSASQARHLKRRFGIAPI